MSRYIDAAVMQDKLRELCDKYRMAYGSHYGGFGKEISEITDKVPAADVQEVVRCKDCVYCRMSYEPKTKISRQICGYVGYNPVQSSEITDYDFCSHGAKMDKEESE